MKGNPFTITFGKEPNLLISRGEETDRIVSVFTSENPLTQSFFDRGNTWQREDCFNDYGRQTA